MSGDNGNGRRANVFRGYRTSPATPRGTAVRFGGTDPQGPARIRNSAAAAIGAGLLSVILVASSNLADDGSGSSGAATEERAPMRQVEVDGIAFRVRQGWTVQRVAAEPLTKWPIVADWDPQGRLVVAESAGVGRPIQEHNRDVPHRIVRLIDRDGDGVFDDRIVAAEAIAFPEGVLCLGDDIFVSAPPEIWRLTDTTGDGVCDRRQVWFDGETITNCANDLHGPYLGRDGWIYWTKGAFGEQTHRLDGGEELHTRASHLFRRRPEGGPIDVVASGGMDNPVAIAFSPEGEKFFSSTFLQHPADGRRDGLAHAVYGGVFGKDHAVVHGHPRTGPLLPVMTHLGAAAPSGLEWIDDPSPGQGGGIALSLFNLHRVTFHRLVPQAASYRTEDHDWLVTDQIDFHPTDVLLDDDGSLIVVDTGGWYDLCCPTSRVDQKTAPGGIYRLWPDAPRIAGVGHPTREPSGRRVDWAVPPAELVSRLDDPRPWVRREAGRRLRQDPESAVPLLDERFRDPSLPVAVRLGALWGLCGIGTAETLESITEHAITGYGIAGPTNPESLRADDTRLARAACHAVGLHRYAAARRPCESLLLASDPALRRAAAEALGRLGDPESIAHLLPAFERGALDRHEEHSRLYALIEIARGDPQGFRNKAVDLWEQGSDGIRGAILLARTQATAPAIRQTDAETQTPGETADFPPSSVLFEAVFRADDRLRETAVATLAGRSDWSPEHERLLDRLRLAAGEPFAPPAGPEDHGTSASPEDVARGLRQLLVGRKHQSEIGRWVTDWIRDAPGLPRPSQRLLLGLLPDLADAKRIPAEWVGPLADWLRIADAEGRDALTARLGSMTVPGQAAGPLTETLLHVAESATDDEERFRILAALPAGSRLRAERWEDQLVQRLTSDDPAVTAASSAVLARIDPSPAAVDVILDRLRLVAPRHLAITLEAAYRGADGDQKARLLEVVRRVPAAKTLPENFLSDLYRRDSPSLRERMEDVSRQLFQPPEEIRLAVDRTLAGLPPGDPGRGLQVFRGSKAQCSACHKMGYLGKDIGPPLTRIGASRTSEALLEAILFPSARQEQSYQSVRVLTVDGRVHVGLVRDETSESIGLQLDGERAITLSRDEIEQVTPSDVSLMPSGIAELLSAQELADLLALLRAAK